MIYPILRILSVTSIYIIPAVTIMINFKKFTLLNTISFSPKLQGLHTLPVVPVKVYTNADLDKESILNENKGRAGVYCWTNKVNGKIYIGSAINLYKRLVKYYNYEHLAKSNMIINKALLNYGFSEFGLQILEYCEPDSAVSREQYYMDLLKPTYNILGTAGSSKGYKHSEEAKAKISAAWDDTRPKPVVKHSEETKAKMSATRKGKKHLEETIAKIRAASLGNKHSEETKAKMAAAKGTGVEVTDIDSGRVEVYVSMRQAAIALNTSLATVREYIKNNKKLLGKYEIVKK